MDKSIEVLIYVAFFTSFIVALFLAIVVLTRDEKPFCHFWKLINKRKTEEED
jgi:hypothetical protein